MTGEHFQKMLTSESFWIWTRNSVIVSVGTTLLGLALAIPAGYAFSRFKFRGRDPAMFAFLLVQMFPGVIILVPYFLVMKALGLLNTSFGLILAYSVTALPLCVWMLKGFFDTVPRELEEAALMDGCSQTQVFWKIVLPLFTARGRGDGPLSFLAAWNEFLLALTFNTSESMYTLPVGLASLISSTGQAWGDFAAASLLVSLPVVVLFIVFQRFLIEGLSAGGVKGDTMVNVTFSGVTKRYDDGFEAVQGLNLEVEDGEFLSCSDRPAGKSTTLRMLAGLEDVTKGRSPSVERASTICLPAPRHRDGLPVLRALPAHERRRQPRLRPAHGQRRGEAHRR